MKAAVEIRLQGRTVQNERGRKRENSRKIVTSLLIIAILQYRGFAKGWT